MKKLTRLFFAALALVLALNLFGCAAAPAEPSATPEPTPTPVPEVNVPVQDIADKLLAMEDMFPSAMGFMGEEMITESCGLDFSLLSEYSLNDPMMNVHAHMLYVAKVKDEAERLFADLGMTLSGAMNIFLHQALIVGGLPFEVRQERPNKATLAAMEEAIRLANDPNAKRFATVDELMEDLRK